MRGKIVIGVYIVVLTQSTSWKRHRVWKYQTTLATRPNVCFYTNVFAMSRAAAFADEARGWQLTDRAVLFSPNISVVKLDGHLPLGFFHGTTPSLVGSNTASYIVHRQRVRGQTRVV